MIADKALPINSRTASIGKRSIDDGVWRARVELCTVDRQDMERWQRLLRSLLQHFSLQCTVACDREGAPNRLRALPPILSRIQLCFRAADAALRLRALTYAPESP